MAPVYIVTGASRGLGYRIAEKLLSAPTAGKVLAVARTEAGLQKLAAAFPGQVEYVTGDLADPATSELAVKTCVDKFGAIDGVVFNAAVIAPVAKIADVDMAALKRIYDINYFASVAALKVATPYLRASKGRVVFISSIASGVAHYFGWHGYGGSKACVDHLAATYAVEEPDVLSVSIDPGVMDTNMQAEIRTEHGTKMKADHIEYLMRVKEDASIASTEGPATVVYNMVTRGTSEFSGKYLVFDDAALAAYQ
ncbi:uncharacterized protein V1510DRAFT_373429 [Dipodascopsis tothii]|uniref:uncharacterized protein n=1 Tax=Dipodascopsis tothii TaxID=44089 RepID=UPI0034CED889